MSVPAINLSGAKPIIGFDAADTSDDRTAKLLLREIQAMLLAGQPRQAVAHICATTGVPRDAAAELVSQLQANVFRAA